MMNLKVDQNILTKAILPISIILVFCTLISLPLPWNEAINDSFTKLQFHIRGERDLSEDFVFIFISAEDIKTIGGWPITHDYFGYLTHVLNNLGTKVIGFYLLFDLPDARYPEYDRMLAGFFKSADNICLSMSFYELRSEPDSNLSFSGLPKRILTGHKPILPFKEFSEHMAGMGFSNLGQGNVFYRVPLVAVDGSQIRYSFGSELARLYLDAESEIKITENSLLFKEGFTVPLQPGGQLQLNHFGGVDRVNAIGLIDLLQTYETSPDSLNFKGKIAVVDVTAPGIANLESTPLASALPVSLIHATVAENILQRNYLRTSSLRLSCFLIALLVTIVWLIMNLRAWYLTLTAGFSTLMLYWVLALFLFSQSNVLLPLFYPTFAFISTIVLFVVTRNRQQKMQDVSIKSLLQEQIITKEAQLAEAKTKLQSLQQQLSEEASTSVQIKNLADERKSAIIELEKQLQDLQIYASPEDYSDFQQFSEIIHSAESKMTDVLALVAKVSLDDIPVLILGETGTGKELIAHAIHESSHRKNAPFVAVNCGALPETLLESELFGHEKGSFTGAQARRKGRFELAHGGTIFLDEITETSPAFQARLLRVLQDGIFERLGGENSIQADIRVVAACNKDLQNEVKQNSFRADLFYRLNGFPISLPPLRQRQQDIPLLISYFLTKYNYTSVSGVSDRAIEILKGYSWPGNVRELENVVRRSAIIAQSEKRNLIQLNDLPSEIQESQEMGVGSQFGYLALDEQILMSLRALKFSHSAVGKTAEALGNRDRGTITEYFRGICFQKYVQANFDLDTSAKAVAGCDDIEILARVQNKITEYLNNLYPLPKTADLDSPSATNLPSPFKGLPRKFHPFLKQIIEHLSAQ